MSPSRRGQPHEVQRRRDQEAATARRLAERRELESRVLCAWDANPDLPLRALAERFGLGRDAVAHILRKAGVR